MSKKYFVFHGQNATTGTPNKITGRMSTYGNLLCFDTREKAIDFVNRHNTGYARDIVVMGTPRTLRKYFLGLSMADYREYCECVQVE